MWVTDFLSSVLYRNGLRNANYLRTVGLRLVGDGRSQLGRREMRGRGNARRRRRESIGRRRGLRLNIIGGDMIVIMIDRGNGSIGIIGRGSIGRRTVRGIGNGNARGRGIERGRRMGIGRGIGIGIGSMSVRGGERGVMMREIGRGNVGEEVRENAREKERGRERENERDIEVEEEGVMI